VSMCCGTFCGQPSAPSVVTAVPYDPSLQQFFHIYSNIELSLSFYGFQGSVSLDSVQPPAFFSLPILLVTSSTSSYTILSSSCSKVNYT
jgi:hypothetical protein